MSWVTTHAAAIQALASVVTVVATSVLAVLTYRYVRLTDSLKGANVDIAAASKAQLEVARAAESDAIRRKAVALKELSRRIRVPVTGRLLDQEPTFETLDSFHYMSHSDIILLESLALEVGEQAIVPANRAGLALRIINEILEEAHRSGAAGWALLPSVGQTGLEA